MDQLLGQRSLESGEAERLSNTPSLNRFPAHKREEVISWEFFNKPIFSQFHNNPKRGMEGSVSGALDDVVMQVGGLVGWFVYSKVCLLVDYCVCLFVSLVA